MALLKFIDTVGAKNFLKGNLRFGLVKDYRNAENNVIIGKQDFEEGRFYTKKYVTPGGNPINFRLEPDEDIGYVLCLYHMGDIPDVKGLKKMTKFGDHVVVLNDEQEFVHRVDAVVKRKDYSFFRRDVFYYNESVEDEIEVMELLSLGKEYFPFLKRKADFSYQKEYRYLIIDADIDSKEKWIGVEVGDLTDIAEIQSTEKFFGNIGIDL